MATEENWHPPDPVLKLESTIKNFARVSDIFHGYWNNVMPPIVLLLM